MIRRILQTKHEKVTTSLMSFAGSRRSSYQSMQLQASITKSKQQKNKNLIQTQSNNSTIRQTADHRQTCISKQLIPTKKNITQVLQQKNQNASCLYSDFMYKSKKTHFLDGIKFQKYKNFLQKQTQQKLILAKKIQTLKAQIQKIVTQKDTVMFAYRALQTKIRQINIERQKQRQRKSKVPQKIFSKQSIKMQKSAQEHYIEQIQEQLMKSRKTLLSHGILQFSNQPISISNISNQNKFQISIKRISQQSKKQAINYMRSSNQKSDPIFEQFNESTNNQEKLRLQNQIQNLKQSNVKLKQQLNSLTEKNNHLSNQLYELSIQIQNQKQSQIKLKSQYEELHSIYEVLKKNYDENQREVERKLQIIKELQQTKYQYLMKEQKQKYQIQQLRKFTQNLEINDQKIKQFIRTQFDSKMSNDIMTQQRLFKQDLSYILHLTKKKQNVYSQFLNENLEKLKQYQTRCFMLQKKQHVAEIFFQNLKNMICQGQNLLNYSALTSLIQRYSTDKRLI